MLLGGIMGNGIDRAFRPEGVVDMIEIFIPFVTTVQPTDGQHLILQTPQFV